MTTEARKTPEQQQFDHLEARAVRAARERRIRALIALTLIAIGLLTSAGSVVVIFGLWYGVLFGGITLIAVGVLLGIG